MKPEKTPMQWQDWSVSAVVAGFVAVLVGFASSVAIVFQAASAAGADQAVTASWIAVLGFAMGITCIGFSWYFKAPVLTAWSTPGAALLASSLTDVSLAEAVGVFMFSAVLTLLLGLSGWFDKLSSRIPLPIAAAMLAGILFKFGLAIFISLPDAPVLVLTMLGVFLAAKRWWPRYAVPLVLMAGLLFASVTGQLQLNQVSLTLVEPVWISPEWSWQALLGVGLPLFLVTMTSQNIPGLAVLKASGYQLPVSPLLSWTGLVTLLTAPLGNFSINLAAITAAICSGPEAHSDPAKRYTAGIAAGVFYLLTGLAGATVVALFAAFPKALVATVAGVALLGTIASNLAQVSAESPHRDAAMLTFLVTASGLSFWGIASPFWGLVAGVVTLVLLNWRRG
ncbi:benzoate/H(+) symporter BenE family transporter [Rheinheimera sp. 4Y26]|uniref:benzoate/H(+) symporter BenE family transporter n=1 Tax=Rheinheimera sp. 4Y26 TaxID=2977811 RepID=UPI0021B0966C|nr:benzoate/H(+) symporter BenE family transporter [Rheinheimera sp. 4Y26]MCT6701075.1 benzoate/H(+) symporter BenE family transporter [Rheinheimera sp. 4Y26]